MFNPSHPDAVPSKRPPKMARTEFPQYHASSWHACQHLHQSGIVQCTMCLDEMAWALCTFFFSTYLFFFFTYPFFSSHTFFFLTHFFFPHTHLFFPHTTSFSPHTTFSFSPHTPFSFSPHLFFRYNFVLLHTPLFSLTKSDFFLTQIWFLKIVLCFPTTMCCFSLPANCCLIFLYNPMNWCSSFLFRPTNCRLIFLSRPTSCRLIFLSHPTSGFFFFTHTHVVVVHLGSRIQF